MEVTVTVTGTPEEVRKAMSLIAALSPVYPPARASNDERSAGDEQPPPTRGDSASFVSLLSDSALDLLQILMEGGDDDEYTAKELAEALGRDVGDIYGILGGIGRAWKKTSDNPNPFGSRWSWRKRAPTWWISGPLAHDIEKALDERHMDRSSEDTTPSN